MWFLRGLDPEPSACKADMIAVHYKTTFTSCFRHYSQKRMYFFLTHDPSVWPLCIFPHLYNTAGLFEPLSLQSAAETVKSGS